MPRNVWNAGGIERVEHRLDRFVGRSPPLEERPHAGIIELRMLVANALRQND